MDHTTTSFTELGRNAPTVAVNGKIWQTNEIKLNEDKGQSFR